MSAASTLTEAGSARHPLERSPHRADDGHRQPLHGPRPRPGSPVMAPHLLSIRGRHASPTQNQHGRPEQQVQQSVV